MITLALTALALTVAQVPDTPATPVPAEHVARFATHLANQIATEVSTQVSARFRTSFDGDEDEDAGGAGVTDTTIAVRKGTRLSVQNFSGTITVNGWDQDRVRVRTASDDRQGVEVSGGSVTLRINGAGGRWGEPRAHDLTLDVPSWMDLDLGGTEVAITVTGVRAAVRAQTVEGSVSLKGGDGYISLKSVDGDVTLSDARGRIELNTVEGEIRATNVSGDLDVQSVDGQITLERVTSQAVSANSVDGDIRFSGAISPGGVYHLESHDGDIVLETPATPDATVSINTFDGEFESDWPVTVQGTDTRRVNFTLGSGKARIELETFDGRITLRRGSAQ